MSRGLAVFLVIAFISLLVVAYGQEIAKQSVQPEAVTEPATQPETVVVEKTVQSLPPSGGPAVGPVLLPGVALLLGSGVLTFTVVWRR